MASDPEFIPVARPRIWGGEEQAVLRALTSRELSGTCSTVREFEREFARRVGAEHAVAVSHGTAALHLALLSLGIAEGDEVIVPDFCMAAPVYAVLYCRARPVLVDVDASWNLDPELLPRHLSARTRAILVVHTYGHPADMPRICRVAARAGLPVVEDAAEALGAEVGGRGAGTLGEIGCFSLYANKAITAGEGGVLVTSDDDLRRTAASLRNMAFGESEETRFRHERIGFNYRLGGLQAALATAQLRHLGASVRRSVAAADGYRARLADLPGVTLPPAMAWAISSSWVFGILIDPAGFGMSRDELRRRLRADGIETRSFFQAAHRYPFLAARAADDAFPRSSRLADHGMYLPSYPDLTEAQIQRVCDRIRAHHKAPGPRAPEASWRAGGYHLYQ